MTIGVEGISVNTKVEISMRGQAEERHGVQSTMMIQKSGSVQNWQILNNSSKKGLTVMVGLFFVYLDFKANTHI